MSVAPVDKTMVYLGLGSNLGDRRESLTRGLAALAQAEIEIVRVSPVVESPALLPDRAPAEWNQPFLNLVAECRTCESTMTVLQRIKRIERELGRVEGGDRWAPRPIDIDILLWGREQIATERLNIPHPGLQKRAFVLTPLISLAPSLTLPGMGTRTVLDWSRDLVHHIPLWMGIVNATPDSFSDGGRNADWASAEPNVEAMVAAGAQIVDVGAESTRPGATPLDAEEEWRRLAPVLEPLIAKYAGRPLRPLVSVDTYHPAVARRALAAGVDLVNDVSGLTQPAMIELAGTTSADWVAMHNLGLPADRHRTLPTDEDPGDAVERWLEERLDAWQRAGLDVDRIIFDPGIGFGKTSLQSLKLLRDAARFRRLGLRCLIGHSRKSFLRGLAPDNDARDLATIGASLNLCGQGVDVIRVHDVPAHVAAYRGWAHLNIP